MATCPRCGVNSRVDPHFEITQELRALSLTSHALAGVNVKTTARVAHVLRHTTCGWEVVGHLEKDHFVMDPTYVVAKPHKS